MLTTQTRPKGKKENKTRGAHYRGRAHKPEAVVEKVLEGSRLVEECTVPSQEEGADQSE